MIRRWLVVPRGTVGQHLARAQAEGIGEIEERDDVLKAEVRTEVIPDAPKARDWAAEIDAATTLAGIKGVLREFVRETLS